MADPSPLVCPAPEYCPALPSSRTAFDVVRGAPGAWLHLIRDWAGRGFLITTGLIALAFFQTNDRREKRTLQRRFNRVWNRLPDLLKLGLSGSAAIEFFVLVYTWYEAKKHNALNAPAP